MTEIEKETKHKYEYHTAYLDREDQVYRLRRNPHSNWSKFKRGSGLSDVELMDIAIQKWEFILDIYEEEPHAYVNSGGSTTCPFCTRYQDDFNTDIPCKDCPISKRTGQKYCYGSPITPTYGQPKVQHVVGALNYLVSIQKELRNESTEN